MKALLTLKKNHEFQRLYRHGTSAVTGCLVVYCRKNRLRRNRVGLTASVKLGNAVKRNRARRRMREVYRLNADKLRSGWDLILVARSRTLTAPWPELNAAFCRLCKKLGLFAAPDASGRLHDAAPDNPEARRNASENPEARRNASDVPEARRQAVPDAAPDNPEARRNASDVPEARRQAVPTDAPDNPEARRNAPDASGKERRL